MKRLLWLSAHRHTSNYGIRAFFARRATSSQFLHSLWPSSARRTPTPGAATAAGSHMLPWYQQARVLRKLTISATGLTAFVCVLHADYGEKPHAFSWLQSYYRAEVVEPLRRQYARLTKKDD